MRATSHRPAPTCSARYDKARRQAEAGAEERRAEVCLDVAAGRETAVVLRRSSGNAALDRLTLESFTKAVAAHPVPPMRAGASPATSSRSRPSACRRCRS